MPSATRITTDVFTGWLVTGGPERMLDRHPDGTLWFAHNHGDRLFWWYSTDEGVTWSYSGSTSDNTFLSSFFIRAGHIDNEGYNHSCGRTDNYTLCYNRGWHSNRRWFWNPCYISAIEALHPDSGLDMVSFRVGSGWKTFITYGTTTRSGSTYTNTLRMVRLGVNAYGHIAVEANYVLRTSTGVSYPYASVCFKHTGDGKTASSTPHVYVVTSVNTPDTSQHQQDDLQLIKFTYESGSWTQGSPVTLEAAVDTTNRVMRCSYDGARVVTVYGTVNRTTGAASGAIHEADWLEATGAVTRHDPPAYGEGVPQGVSSAVDPATGDIYVIAYGNPTGSDADTTPQIPLWNHYQRGPNAWGTWTSIGVAVGGVPRTGRVSLKQYVSQSTVEIVYGTGATAPWGVYYLKLTTINSAPSVPVLRSPTPSSIVDLGTQGAVFSWTFIDPDPGDGQGAWQMRRRVGVGAYSYYTAATQTWGATAVWNTGASQQVSFPAGVWTNGSTWSWSVNTRDIGGLSSGFAPDVTVVASVSPVVTVIGPQAVYAADSSPVITWDYTASFPQSTYQIRLIALSVYTGGGFNPASSTAVWDSGETASVQARSARAQVTLLNGATYRAYMRVADSNGLYSGWAYSEFVLSLSPPPSPLLEVAVVDDHLSGLGRVRLTVQGVTNMLSANQSYVHPTGDAEWLNDTNTTIGNSTTGVVASSTYARKMTSIAAGDMRIVTYAGVTPIDTTGAVPPTPRDFAVAPGQVYTAVASFTADATPRNVRVTLRWYSPADVLVATTQGVFLADIVGFPVQATVSAVCPLTADRVRLVLEVLGPTAAGEIHYVDAVDLHPGKSTVYSNGGLIPTQTLLVTRSTDGGVTGTPVRAVNGVSGDAYQHIIAYDRDMPFGTAVTYTAQAVNVLTNDQYVASDPSPAALAQVDSEVWAVRDPLDQDGEARALVTSYTADRATISSVYRPAGRVLPLVETEGSTGDDGSMTLFMDTVALRRGLRDLLNRPTTLLVQAPSGDSWYVFVTDQKVTAQFGQGQTVDVNFVQVDTP